MSSSTTNLGLTKPAIGEAADITVLNTNADVIDSFAGGYFAKRTSDGAGITSTTLADDAVLQVTLPVGTFLVDTAYFATGSTTSADLKVAWAFTGTASSSFRGGIGPTVGTAGVTNTSVIASTAAAITTAVIYGCDAAAATYVRESGFLVVTVTGILKIQFAAGTSGTMTPKAGSYLACRRVA